MIATLCFIENYPIIFGPKFIFIQPLRVFWSIYKQHFNSLRLFLSISLSYFFIESKNNRKYCGWYNGYYSSIWRSLSLIWYWFHWHCSMCYLCCFIRQVSWSFISTTLSLTIIHYSPLLLIFNSSFLLSGTDFVGIAVCDISVFLYAKIGPCQLCLKFIAHYHSFSLILHSIHS